MQESNPAVHFLLTIGDKSMEYTIIESDNTKELILLVNKRLQDGWLLHGGVSTSTAETDDWCYFIASQAMIRAMVVK